ncbi:MAG: tetratricopeptide repeat protein [Candidatus Rokubacteria bacterium]|nr:tetratricopeptide repeat protein [Candidatus Rokubacteria bacterium]
MSPLYGWLGPADLLAWRFLFPTLSFALVTVGLVVGRRRWPGALAAWVSSALMVLPVSGLVMRAGPYLAADRYSYLSSLGLALLGGGALRHWWLAGRWPADGRRRAAVLAGLLVVVLGALGTLTRGQIHVWRDSETLWTHATSVAPSSIAHFNLGLFRETQGLRQKAAEHYRRALAINPDLAQAHSGLGLALAQESRIPEALFHLREEVRLNPGSSRARKNLAAILVRQGRTAEAIEQLRRAVQLSPGDTMAHNDLGNALAVQGQLDEAVQHYQEVLKLTPESPEVHNNLGMVRALQGRKSEAVEHFRRALSIRPGFQAAQKNLDWALAGGGPAR